MNFRSRRDVTSSNPPYCSRVSSQLFPLSCFSYVPVTFAKIAAQLRKFQDVHSALGATCIINFVIWLGPVCLTAQFEKCLICAEFKSSHPLEHLMRWNATMRRNQVQAQLDYGPGSEIGAGWKIGVTWSRKRGFKMAATELGYLLTKSPFWLSLWHDISISWHGGQEL